MAASSETEVDKVLKLADTVHEVSPIKQVSIVASPQGELAGLVEQIQKLTLQVNALSHQARGRSRSRVRQRGSQHPSATPVSPSGSEFSEDDGDRLCYYHRVFKQRANKCRSPCSWTGNDARRQ